MGLSEEQKNKLIEWANAYTTEVHIDDCGELNAVELHGILQNPLDGVYAEIIINSYDEAVGELEYSLWERCLAETGIAVEQQDFMELLDSYNVQLVDGPFVDDILHKSRFNGNVNVQPIIPEQLNLDFFMPTSDQFNDGECEWADVGWLFKFLEIDPLHFAYKVYGERSNWPEAVLRWPDTYQIARQSGEMPEPLISVDALIDALNELTSNYIKLVFTPKWDWIAWYQAETNKTASQSIAITLKAGTFLWLYDGDAGGGVQGMRIKRDIALSKYALGIIDGAEEHKHGIASVWGIDGVDKFYYWGALAEFKTKEKQ